MTSVKNLVDKGLSVIKIAKGTKRALGEWKSAQSKPFEWGHLRYHDGEYAMVCGAVAGVECIDIDLHHDPEKKIHKQYASLIKKQNPELLKKLVIQKTQSGGYHFVYKSEIVEGNRKLANRFLTDQERQEQIKEGHKVSEKATASLIETRGEGGYFLIEPSAGYEVIQGGFEDIPVISIDERDLLFSTARALDRAKEALNIEGDYRPKQIKGNTDAILNFNLKYDVVEAVLNHGWQQHHSKGRHIYFKRPGNTKTKWGADYHLDKRIFYVFTSSTQFENGKGYSPFGVYAYLEHNGDYKDAYKAILELGYGDDDIKIEKEEIKEEDYLLDENEGWDYVDKSITGKLEKGYGFGYPAIDKYLMFKDNQYLLVVGKQNVGKTTSILWLMTQLIKVNPHFTFLALTIENTIGQIKRILSVFYIGKHIREFNEDDKTKARTWIFKHFKFINPKKRYSYMDVLKIASDVYQHWKFKALLIDPYNALAMNFKQTGNFNSYDYHLEASNTFQNFTKNITGIILNAHVTTGSQRDKNRPILDMVQGGTLFTNKADDGIVIHRDLYNREQIHVTEISVEKIKDTETGGYWTGSEPIRIVAQPGMTGFWIEGSAEHIAYINSKKSDYEKRKAIHDSGDEAPF